MYRMLKVRKANERGHADYGWLDTYHTFSFGSYQDPEHMGFRSLRVMNEDHVSAGKGFGTHGHRNMEIVSYVLSGALEHKDSMGNGETLRPGEFQRITAGTGITHSEFNPSVDEPSHFYQIWLQPERDGIEPSYEQRSFDPSQRQNRWQLVASGDPVENALKIHQDAKVFLSTITRNHQVEYHFADARHGWLQVLRGKITLGTHELETSDGVAISNETSVSISAGEDSEVMLFDLA